MVIPRGSGFGGSAHVPSQAPDSLQAMSFATVVDAYSEGECVGLCDRNWNPITDPKLYGKGIFLNKTPLMNDDGQVNFDNVYVSQVFGTQSQSYLPGASIVSNTIPDGRELRFNITKTIAIAVGENDADRLGIAFSFPAIFEQKDNGDIVPVQNIRIKVEVQLNSESAYTDQIVVVGGTASSEYVREVMVKLPRSSNPSQDSWLIYITRLTADSTKFTLKNSSFISYYSKITDEKFRYPNTAAIMIHGDAKQFTSFPSRGFRVKLLKIRVPSNYFPDTRKYTRDKITGDDTGVEQDWDGTFYTAWSNTPPWIFYDMLTNPRYGLGKNISVENIDKWTLYDIARYCDELVDDGHGFKEPRFVCNVYFQVRQEAFKVLNDLASVFRSIFYYASGTIVCAQDSKKAGPPLYNFTNAAVKDGVFSYQGTDVKTRHTVAIVRWNDPEDFYSIKYEEVQDTDGIIRYNYNPIEVAAFGCTSRGQAHRLGKWILATELYETEILTFSAVLDGMYLRPGDIIGVYDQFRAGARRGGRVLKISDDRTQVTLDSFIPISANQITWESGLGTFTLDSPLFVANDLSTDWSSLAAGAVVFAESLDDIFRVEEVFKNEGGYWTLRLDHNWTEATDATRHHHICPFSAMFVAPTSFAYPGQDIGSSANIGTIRPSQLIQRGVLNNTSEGDVNILTLSAALPAEVVVGSIWSVEEKTLQAQLFRIAGITETNSYEYGVSATKHNPSKFDQVESNVKFVTRPITAIHDFGTVLSPNNPVVKPILLVRPEGYIAGLNVSWQAPPDPTIVGYGLVYRKDGGNWQFITEVHSTTYDFDYGNKPGKYEFQIYAYNSAGVHSPFAYCFHVVKNSVYGKNQDGKITFKPTGLEISGQGNNNLYAGRDVKYDWRLNSTSTSQDIGSETWGASSGGFDPSFDYFEISLWDVATNKMVWRKQIGKNLSYTLSYNENIEAFGHPQGEYIFQVVGFDIYNNFTEPARIRVNNPAPAAPTNLTSVAAFQNAFLKWLNSTDRDIAYTQIYGASTTVGATPPVFADALPIYKTVWPASSQAISGLATDKTHYFWVSHVDTFGSESIKLGPTTVTPSGLRAVDIDDFFFDASKIFSEAIVLHADFWTPNLPDAGKITWNAHEIYYRGVAYPIAGGNTDKKYVWWVGPTFNEDGSILAPANASYTVGDIKPDLANNVFVIASNVGGVAVLAWTNIANAVIGTANIIDAAIVRAKIGLLAVDDARIASLDAAKITTGFLDAQRIQAGTIVVSKLGSDVTPANLGAETPTGAQARADIAQALAEAASLAKGDYLTPSTTTIDGGHITTNTIDANRIKAGTTFTHDLYVGALLQMATGGMMQSEEYVSSGGNAGWNIPSSGRIHAVEIITQNPIIIRNNSYPVFVNVLDSSSVLTSRKYTDNDDISLSVTAPAGEKVRFESGTDKRVTPSSPYWPNAANTGDGVGPSDFLGYTINYVAGSTHSNFTGRISACVATGASGEILSDEISIVLVHEIPATPATSVAPPIPDAVLTGGHGSGDHNTLTLSSTLGGTIFVAPPGETAFRVYTVPLDLAPGAVAHFYQVVNGLQSDVGDETNPNDP
jgi:predicted phage tail protein